MLFRPSVPIICLLLVGAPLGRTDEGPTVAPTVALTLSADTDWQHIEDKAGVTLYSRARVGSGIKEFKGTGLIGAPPGTVEKVLADVSRYPSFMPYVTESRAVAEEGNETTTYQRLDVPFVSNRDYTVRVEHGTTKGPEGIVYRDTWQTDNEAGPPERHGIVRVKVNEGSWLLEPAGTAGGSTQATYQIYTDSGGVVPAFLANRASQMIIPRLFEAIRKQARQPQYR